MNAMALDHVAQIERVIAALDDDPPGAVTAVHVLADAYVTVAFGAQLGLTPAQCLQQVRDLLRRAWMVH